MLFNSFHFLVFFLVVTTLYFALPHKLRWILLLGCSCYFYMAFIPIYILILGFTIVIDYFAGIYLEKLHDRKRKWFLIASLIANIGVLGIFKYYNFINENLSSLLGILYIKDPIPFLKIILPIGLSFHTFQAMSYTIEVYRGNQKAEHNFGIYSLYVMFYPQLVAGPIERPQNLIHQFYEKHYFDYERVTDGLKMIAWGLFKKVVIADRLAVISDTVFDNANNFQGLSLIIGVVFFSFQIYCDFSGYSDIAIGAAKIMGFKLMTNFRRPYFSQTISEFWKRWHISLSTWFKDYLYISLGGNRVIKWRWYFNLFFVFLVSGLWHGANWTYVVWGGLHGFYLVFAIITLKHRTYLSSVIGLNKLPRVNIVIQVLTTFILAAFSWIFFRSKNLNEAFYIISHLFNNLIPQINDLLWVFKSFILRQNNVDWDFSLTFSGKYLTTLGQFIMAIMAILIMEVFQYIQETKNIRVIFNNQAVWVRWLFYYAIIFLIIFFGVFENRQFIYFQF